MKRLTTYGILLILSTSGCEINQKAILPEDGFLKIYNHPEESLAFYPESLIELPDGAYLFVSAVKDENSDIEYPSTQVVRTDARGEVSWSQTYDWLAPASKLINMGSSMGFVAMDAQLNAHAILIDPTTGEIEAQHDLEVTMPLAAYTDEQGKLLVLAYDVVSRSSWISKFSESFLLERSNMLPVNTDLDLLIQRHLNKTGVRFPFFIGEFSNTSGRAYLLSCFHNYTLRTVFLDQSSLNVTGDIFSYQIDEAISSVIHKSGLLFGLTGYYEDNNYIVSETEIDINSSQSIKDFPAKQLYELTRKARVVSTVISRDGEEYALFISQTNANSIVIYQYAMESDSLINTIHRTFDQRVEVSDVIQTRDQGVAILAGIYLAGKHRRPVLIKEPVEVFFPDED